MWIMLNDAFLSIVEPDNRNGAAGSHLLVRSRVKGHIERTFPGANVQAGRGTDYEYRALIRRGAVVDTIANRVATINYGNFKNSVKDKPYHDALMGVWSIMHRLQESMMPKRRGRQSSFLPDDFDRLRGFADDDVDFRPHRQPYR